MFVDYGPLSLMSFIVWLGSYQGLVLFFVAPLFLWLSLGDRHVLFVYLGTLCWHFLCYIYTHVLPIKKKKKSTMSQI